MLTFEENRLIRAATYEGMSDTDGFPSTSLRDLYELLAKNEVKMLITGFVFTSRQGRAMQPHQGGLDHEEKIEAWKNVIRPAQALGARIFAQISHTGRQTLHEITGHKVVGPSSVRCSYFKQKVTALTEEKITEIIDEYGHAAFLAKQAGFDGIQLHCAHGYLIHQFLSSYTNRRRDQWGGSHKNRFRFAHEILKCIKAKCGDDFTVIVKLSGADDRGMTCEDAGIYAEFFESTGAVAAIEVSYGSMEYALNIIRGGIPIQRVLTHNVLFRNYPTLIKKIWLKTIYPQMRKKFIPFKENYNLENARSIRKRTKLPIILTGGIRSGEAINSLLSEGFAAVSLCRPFICEPDFAVKLRNNPNYKSRCTNCNCCSVMCDSESPLKCYLPVK